MPAHDRFAGMAVQEGVHRGKAIVDSCREICSTRIASNHASRPESPELVESKRDRKNETPECVGAIARYKDHNSTGYK